MAEKVLLLMLVLGAIAVTSITGQQGIGLTGPEIRRLQLGQNPELLQFAAMYGETRLIIIDGPETIASAQENVNLNINCLPWLQRFPGASLKWFFQQLTEDGEPDGSPEVQHFRGGNNRQRMISGDFDEWYNITGTILTTDAGSITTGRFACEACYFSGIPGLEECHRANLSIQIIGGPPVLDSAESDADPETDASPGELVYRIGADFCIPRDFNQTLTIRCLILNFPNGAALNVSRAFPEPSRTWFMENDFLYNSLDSSSPEFRNNIDFFMSRPILMPDLFVPNVFTPIPSGDQRGALLFNYQMDNGTVLFPPVFQQDAFLSSADKMVLRTRLSNTLAGTWTCIVNNTFGSARASSTIRLCEDAPLLPGCPRGSDDIIFPGQGEVVPAGCTVCVPEGTLVTLDCTGQGVSTVGYTWRDSMGRLISNMARFSTSRADNYTCTASSADNPTETAISVLAFSDRINFNFRITEQGSTAPRQDNGCSRLSDQSGLEETNGCVFLEETINLNCFTDDNTPLPITFPSSTQFNGTASVPRFSANSSYSCNLASVEGPCGGAIAELEFTLFDPATIDRSTALIPGCNYGAGRATNVVVQSPNSTFTLCCPTDGIEDPNTTWYRVVVDPNTGCASEVPENGIMSGNTLQLTTQYFGTGATFVCRTSNRAGADADIVSFRSQSDEPMWVVGQFSQCSLRCREGIRTRTVVCRSVIDNMVLPDTSCVAGDRPNMTASCANEFPDVCFLDPVWISGEWTQCTSQCGGWRFRRVVCQVVMTGEIRPGFECNGQVQPASYDTAGCQRDCCREDANPLYCRNMGAGYCADEAFSKSCCWTCGRKTIGRFG